MDATPSHEQLQLYVLLLDDNLISDANHDVKIVGS